MSRRTEGIGAPEAGRYATLLGVTDNSERGADIQRRLDAIGISDREFYEKTGIDRKTLRRAIGGEVRVRLSTYAAIESALDKLEEQLSGGPVVAGMESHDLIEFDISGDFGVHLVVRGPVADAEALKRQVVDIIREIRKGDKDA